MFSEKLFSASLSSRALVFHRSIRFWNAPCAWPRHTPEVSATMPCSRDSSPWMLALTWSTLLAAPVIVATSVLKLMFPPHVFANRLSVRQMY